MRNLNPLVPALLIAILAVGTAIVAPVVTQPPPLPGPPPPGTGAKYEAWIIAPQGATGIYGGSLTNLYVSPQAGEKIERLDAKGDSEALRRLNLEQLMWLVNAPARAAVLEEQGKWAKVVVLSEQERGRICWVRRALLVR